MSKKIYILGGVIIFLIIILVVVLAFSSKKAPTPSSGQITLTWWKTFETSDNVQQLIDDYEQTHKNVTINYVKKDETTYEQDLLTAFASGNAPDIFSIHNDWLPMEQDKLAPMPANIADVRSYESNFVNVASDDFIKDNQIYAVPMNVDVMALYYNKDILGSAGIAQPPTNWQDMVKDVEKITKQSQPGNFSRSGLAFGVADNVNRAVDIVSLLMLQNNTQFYNQDHSQATFDQEQSLNFNPGATALQYFTQFSDPTSKAYSWNAKSDNSIDDFTEGKAAMMLSYYYMTPQIEAKAPNLDWGVVPVPQPTDDSVKVNFANYWGEAVSKTSANQAAAWDFLNFITSKDELTKYYTKHKLIPSRTDILSDPSVLSDPDIGVYAESALTAKSVYKKDPDGFEQIFSQMIDDVSSKGLTPEQAVSNAAQQVNAQLQR